MNPKLTIITINLNNAEVLRKTIESVVSQTFSDYEYIVIDGASTDGSVDIIKQYSNKITYWISEPDKGIYNAMNKGINKSNGDFCFFLNSGDWLVDNVLNEVFSVDRNEDIVFGNIINEYKDKENSIECGAGEKEMTFYNFYETVSVPHQAAFIKRKLFLEYGLYDETFSVVSDWLFFMKMIVIESVSIVYVKINITHYNPYGISSVRSTYENERERALNSILPKKVLEDYVKMKELYEENRCLRKELDNLNHRFRYINELFLFFKKVYKNKLEKI